jgi:hypothetical protein
VSHQAQKSSSSDFILLDVALKYHTCALQIRRDGSNRSHPASSGAIRELLALKFSGILAAIKDHSECIKSRCCYYYKSNSRKIMITYT